MNETIKTILSRRSIRNYKQEQIKDEELQAILEAGIYAPSAANQQSWHITAVQNKDMLNKINESCKAAYSKSGNARLVEAAKSESFCPFYNAPTLILVFGDEKAIAPHNDGTLALENMFIAAASLGIGSCWINAMKFLFSSEEGKALKKELGIPEGYILVGAAAFGYNAGETPSPAPRKENTVNIIK